MGGGRVMPGVTHTAAAPTSRRDRLGALGAAALTEEQVQRAVVAHLERRGVVGLVFFAVPNGGGRSRVDAAVLKATGLTPGAPDLLAFLGGQAFALELKRERGGRVSPAQAAMHHALAAAAAGLDEALETLEKWGLIR